MYNLYGIVKPSAYNTPVPSSGPWEGASLAVIERRLFDQLLKTFAEKCERIVQNAGTRNSYWRSSWYVRATLNLDPNRWTWETIGKDELAKATIVRQNFIQAMK